MKKLAFVTFLMMMVFVSMTTVQAQEKCKFVAQGKDPITGITFKIVGAYFVHVVPLVFEDEWVVNIDRRGDNYTLYSKCENTGIFEDRMLIGDSLILKLDNDNVIALYTTKVAEPLHHSVNNENLVRFSSAYAMKIEDVELLTTAKVVYARINFGAKTRTVKIKDKDAIVLQKGAICILK